MSSCYRGAMRTAQGEMTAWAVKRRCPGVLFLLLMACDSETQAPPPPPPGQEHQQKGQGPPLHNNQGQAPPGLQSNAAGGSSAEDLSDSWNAGLTTPVAQLLTPENCPDMDGDGFVSAQACPGGDPAKLDCDDSNPQVTPGTERWVRPGPFIMGSASDHAGYDEGPVHVVMLAGFCLDRSVTSAADFSAWLLSTGRTPEGPDVRSIEPDGSLSTDRGTHPVEGVSWNEARDYCLEQGKQLATEAQWEKAARGGCEGGSDPTACDAADLVPYPWGTETPSCALANHNLSTSLPPTLCTSDTTALGAQGGNTGPYGHRNLSGNVWEYVADFYHPLVYSSAAMREDPGGPEEGTSHVLRGGGWNTFSTNMRAANRFSDMVMGSAAGIRCARPSLAARPDKVAALQMVTLSGIVKREGGLSLSGRALYITVFDSADADPQTGMLTPGRSPVSEARLAPGGGSSQSFEIQVPAGRTYLLQSSLDDGSGNDKEDYFSASGSGGFGESAANPIIAHQDRSDLLITLKKPPEGGPGTAPAAPGGPGAAPPPRGGPGMQPGGQGAHPGGR